MLVLVLLASVWTISGCVGAILLDGDESGPINLSYMALGPVALLVGARITTEVKE